MNLTRENVGEGHPAWHDPLSYLPLGCEVTGLGPRLSQPLVTDMTLRSLKEKELFKGKSSLGEGKNKIDLGAAHMNQSDWVCAWI